MVPKSGGTPSHTSQSEYRTKRLSEVRSARRCSSIRVYGQAKSAAPQQIYHQHLSQPQHSGHLLERSFLDKCDLLQMGQE